MKHNPQGLAMSRLVVVLGASGRIGTGFIKASLESQHELKIVGVFRSNESAKKTVSLIGDPSSDKFTSVIGDLATEESAVEIRDNIEKNIGSITDLIISVGRGIEIGPILNQSLDDFRRYVSVNKLEPHFCVAKAFIPFLCNRPNTSCTFINGATAVRPYPGGNNMSVANGAQAMFTKAIFSDYKDKDIRMNEILIACPTREWDKLPPGAVSNIEMGKTILGVLIHPTARSLSMMVYKGNMEQIARTGTTDNVCNILLYF